MSTAAARARLTYSPPVDSRLGDSDNSLDFVGRLTQGGPDDDEPPTRVSSFAGDPEPGSLSGTFTREDEFRVVSLQRILSSHSAHPLDEAEAHSLCAELEYLEQKQQQFLRASIEQMQLSSMSSLNTDTGRRGGWAVGKFFDSVKSAAGRAAAAVAGRASGAPGGYPSHSLASSSNVTAPLALAGKAKNEDCLPTDCGGSDPSSPSSAGAYVGVSDDSASAGRAQLLAQHHQRVLSSNLPTANSASTLVRRVVGAPLSTRPTDWAPLAPAAGNGGGSPGYTPSHAPTPADLGVSSAAYMLDMSPSMVSDDDRSESSTFKDHRNVATSFAVPQPSFSFGIGGRTLKSSTGAFSEATSGAVLGGARPVVLLTASLLLALTCLAPSDTFAVGALRHEANKAQQLPEMQERTALHSVFHAIAATAAFAAAVFISRTGAAAARRERFPAVLRGVQCCVTGAVAALTVDVILQCYALLHAFADMTLLMAAWTAVDICAGSTFALLWRLTVDGVILFTCSSILRATTPRMDPVVSESSRMVTPRAIANI
jgi:hypothetical protein